MTKSQEFTSLALDKLINESLADADDFEEELKKIDETQLVISDDKNSDDDYLEQSDKTWGETKNIINKTDGSSVSFNYVYQKIADLIDNGNAAMQMLQSIDLDVADPQLITSTATLINSIKGCISEFTKIHQQWVRFNQVLKLEQIKFENKKRLMKYRNDLNNGTDEEKTGTSPTDLIEVKTGDLVEFLQWKKEKEQREKLKDEKI